MILVSVLFFVLAYYAPTSNKKDILEKWELLVNYSSTTCPSLPDNQKLEMAIKLEKAEKLGASKDEISLIRLCPDTITVGT